MKIAAALTLLCAVAVECAAQAAPEMVATPNRPTVTSTADTTQLGVLEIEFGVGAAARQQSLQGLLKFGVLRDLELQWAGSPWQHNATLHQGGVTDTGLGFKWRFLHQGKRRPTLSFQYNVKLPTAGAVLGTGQADHIVTLLATKDLPARFHFDANLNSQWLGRPGGRFDHNWLPDFTLSRSIARKWAIAMEFSGNTRANAAPAVVQNLWAVSYAVKRRLMLDSAVQFRIAGPVPNVTFLAGFTYSIADLYHRKW